MTPHEFMREERGKTGHPITCHADTEGRLRHSFTFSLTSALEWGGWSKQRPCHTRHPTPIVLEARWDSATVWTNTRKLAPFGFRRRMVQPVVSCYTDYAIIREVSRSNLCYYPDWSIAIFLSFHKIFSPRLMNILHFINEFSFHPLFY